MEYFAVVQLRALIAQEAELGQAKRTHAGLLSRQEKIPAPAMAPLFIAPVAKPIKGQSHQSPHSTLSPSSKPSSTDDFIEHVLSFVRPPGTGTTSLGRSISRALDRRQRIALGSVGDDDEIRGHLRTYVAFGLLTQRWSYESSFNIVSIYSAFRRPQIR